MNNQTESALLAYARATDNRFIPFDAIAADHFVPAIEAGFAEARENIAAIVGAEMPTHANTIVALEHAQRTLSRAASVFVNLKEAHATPDILILSETIMAQLAAFSNEVFLNEELFARVKAVKESYDADAGAGVGATAKLSVEDARLLERTYAAFVRQGALLQPAQKVTLQALDQDIARLTTQFGNQLQHSVNAFRYVVRDQKQLAGLPEHAIVTAKEEAAHKDMPEAWVFTLHMPSLLPVLQYADDEELRKALWMAWNKEGMGPGNMSDNRPVIRELVHARHKRAVLLGFDHHAAYVLADRMAKDTAGVQAMFDRLSAKAKPQAEAELEKIRAYKTTHAGSGVLEPWDVAYYAEKVRKEDIDFNDEELRPYFGQQAVFEGMFAVTGNMYGITAKKNETVSVYHPDVFAYDISGADDRYLGTVYFDLFPRSTKRQGAWIETLQPQDASGRAQLLIVGNMSRPTEGSEALLSHNDVVTLFHEFGHATHWLFSEVSYSSIAGFNVLWDFCELPSQFFDSFAEDAEVLRLFAKHHKTGEVIPDALCEKITTQKTYMTARQMLAQVALSYLDLAWHDGRGNEATHHKEDSSVEEFEYATMTPYRLMDIVPGTSRSTSFRHIFSGGYDVGYYSYHWAEMLAADAFEYFKAHGLFDPAIASAFREHVLSKGNTEDPAVLYARFRGQAPDPDALLRSKGIA